MFVVPFQDENNWLSSHVPTFSAVDSSYSLPKNIAVVTLQVCKHVGNMQILLPDEDVDNICV